jgi:hypothetical protein
MASIRRPLTPPEKSEVYKSAEKPVQLPKTLESVNEKIAMMMMGA